MLVVLLAGCGSDQALSSRWCAGEAAAFDIEEISVLEDAQGIVMGHDALELQLEVEVPEGARWRVRRVDVMPILPRDAAETYADGQKLTVEVWEGRDPTATTPWTVEQRFHVDELTWEDAWLAHPNSTAEHRWTRAWWSFDFGETIPVEGMEGTDYLVGVAWAVQGEPTLGYSNYELRCDLNWTDHADGRGFVQNGTRNDQTCSWPMLRVHVELIEEALACREGTYEL